MGIKDFGDKKLPWWRQCFCIHEWTGGAITVTDRKGRKKHARVCVKCGRRYYLY